jgi:hypothetical protein
VPVNDSISFTELSRVVSLPESLTRDTLRHAIANGIFQENTHGHVAHSPMSKLLLEPEMDAWISHSLNDVFPAVPMVLESWKRFPATNEPNESGFSLAIGNGKTLFQYLAEDPFARGRFSLAMSGLTADGGYDIQYLVKGYRWSDLPSGATVVDVRPYSPESCSC